jgi:uncharacterized membrane protein YphA (DoxX/SURF4 family)
LILIFYGVGKLGDPADFLKSIHTYGILPTDPAYWLNLSAIALPWLEILAGIAILLGVLRRGAGALSAITLAVFSAAILVRTFDIMSTDGTAFMDVAFDCGCGSGVVVIWEKMIFNSSLFVTSLLSCLELRK